jgi:hypothetical protein
MRSASSLCERGRDWSDFRWLQSARLAGRKQSGIFLSCQRLAIARGGFFASATAIAEISGRMKNASSAG